MNKLIAQIRNIIESGDIKDAFHLMQLRLVNYMSINQKNSLSLIRASHEDMNREILDGTLDNEQKVRNNIRKNILDLLNTLEIKHTVAEARYNLEDEKLIKEDRFPFLKRTGFRRRVVSNLQSKSPPSLFVKGNPKSGLSYLKNFLEHLSYVYDDMNIEIYSLDMLDELNEPGTDGSSKIIRSLLEITGLREAEIIDGKYKFIRLRHLLLELIDKKKIFPVFFLHDFHKVKFIPEDVYRLIYQLADIKANCLFIFTGLDYNNIPNWSQIKNGCDFYEIPENEITLDNIRECFYRIFERYKTNIINSLKGEEIEFDDYYKAVSQIIFADGKGDDEKDIDICTIGNNISNHLFHIRSYQ